MIGQRFTCLLMIGVLLTGMVLVSGEYGLPVFIFLIGILGTFGKWRWNLRPSRRVIAILIVTLFFGAYYRLFSPREFSQMGNMVNDPRWLWIAECFVSLMTLQLFLTPRSGWYSGTSLFGLMALLSTGLTITASQAMGHFLYIGTAYLALMVIFSGQIQVALHKVPRHALYGKRLWAGTILLIVMVGGGFLGQLLNRQYYNIDSLLIQLQSSLYSRYLNQTSGTVGFSRNLKLNDIKKIQQTHSDDVALQVFSPTPPTYLRAQVLDTYANAQWNATAQARELSPTVAIPAAIPLPGKSNQFLLQEPPAGRWQAFDIWPSPDLGQDTGFLVTASTCVLEAPVKTLALDDQGMITADDLFAGVNYYLAAPEQPIPATLSQAQMTPYVQVPSGLDPCLPQLAYDLTKNGYSTSEKIAAVIDYFHRNYTYHLGLAVPADQDPLTYFLREKPPAHCEYFASGAALLLRLAGVPCRVATGFIVAERNTYLKCWIARNRNAHAWVEAWDADQGHWVIVEATPPDESAASSASSRWEEFWEALKFRLQELRVAIHLHGLKGLGVWLGQRLWSLTVLLFTTLPGWVLIILAGWLLGRKIIRRWRWNPRPKKDPLIAALNDLLHDRDRRMKKKGFVRPPHETLHQFAARIENTGPSAHQNFQQAATWYRQYAQVRYRGSIHIDDVHHLSRLKIDT